MNGTGIPDDMILPLAAGLGAAVVFILVFFMFRKRSDSSDPTLSGPASAWLSDSGTPPPDPASSGAIPMPPPAPDAPPGADGHAYLEQPALMGHIKKMQEGGASAEDIMDALAEGFDIKGGEKQKEIMKKVMMNVVTGKGPMPGKSGFTFKANVSMDTSSGHESLHMEQDQFARARDLAAKGTSLDGICRELNPEYRNMSADQQRHFQHMMRTLLRMGGVDVGRVQ